MKAGTMVQLGYALSNAEFDPNDRLGLIAQAVETNFGYALTSFPAGF